MSATSAFFRPLDNKAINSLLGSTAINSVRKLKRPLGIVFTQMAGQAKCDQVVQCVVAEPAPLHQMMNLQVLRRTTVLTSPPITFQHASMKQFVLLDT
jgi:hypothetical protein